MSWNYLYWIFSFVLFSVNRLLTRNWRVKIFECFFFSSFLTKHFLFLIFTLYRQRFVFNSLPRHYTVKAYWLLCHPLWHFSHHHRRQHIRASTKFACRSCWMRSQRKHAILHFHFFFFLCMCVCYTESRTFQRKLRKLLFQAILAWSSRFLRTYE